MIENQAFQITAKFIEIKDIVILAKKMRCTIS